MASISAAEAAPSRWRLWLALIAVAIPVQMTTTASPFLNGAVMDARALTSAEIGTIRTVEILINASVQIWLSARIRNFAPRDIALLGAGVLLLGNLICLLPGGAAELGAGRSIAGAGSGALQAAMAAFIAQAKSPHRVAGAMAIPVTLAAIATALIVGRTAETLGQTGVFGVIAIGGALSLVITVCFAPGGKPHASFAPRVTSMLGALKSPYVLACFTIYIGSTAGWHFFERIGISHGLEPSSIGDLSAMVAVACGLAAPIAMLVRDAWVRPAMILTLISFGIGSSLIPFSTGTGTYTAGFLIQSVAFTYWVLFSAAVASRLDRTGGLGAAGSGWNAFGNALSPALGGFLILGGSYAPLGWLCIAASIVTVTLMTIATHKLPPATLTRT